MPRIPGLTLWLVLLATAHAAAESMDPASGADHVAPKRIEADRVRDAMRRPDEVLAFLGIQPGMRVLDLFSGGGYYAEVVSRIVGDSGEVVAHNNQAYLDYAADELALRFAEGRLGNVTRLTAEANELALPNDYFDAALVMLTWHDFYFVDPANGWPSIDLDALIDRLCAALKPGAVLGVSDHVAAAGSDPHVSAPELHRIDPQRIRDDLAGTCFVFEAESDLLRNPVDDRTRSMYAPGIRGRTDQVVFRFRRQ